MKSLFERLGREESAVRERMSVLRERAEQLHKELEEADERLHRLAITREMLESLPAEDPGGEAQAGPSEGDSAAGVQVRHRPEASFRTSGPTDLEEGRQRMLTVLATAGRAMKAREIAAAIGEDVSKPARVETARGRLKRLAEEGRVIEGPVGWFAIATAVGSSSGEGAAEG